MNFYNVIEQSNVFRLLQFEVTAMEVCGWNLGG
jgi:hypothetical protein